MATVTATCVLCNKTQQVDVPPGHIAVIDHYQNDKIVVRPSVLPIK